MYEKLKKLVKAGDELVKVGEAIAADGEIDFADVQHLPKLAGPVQDLYDCLKEKDEILKELMQYADDKLEELKA